MRVTMFVMLRKYACRAARQSDGFCMRINNNAVNILLSGSSGRCLVAGFVTRNIENSPVGDIRCCNRRYADASCSSVTIGKGTGYANISHGFSSGIFVIGGFGFGFRSS